ncbi:Tat (twin-arginine translocation) pathway signal sequence [Nitrosomonas eutropha]|uniref:Tat (Twin-arginine translocation) pathway signal sequence n=1 Tax=Nitrosomonas eutropha TaxID=916 RepID=A0A1I7F9Z8_9PROT|nr:twin-arginine translocation signal domain-containing protein [Nitrosomonas eutropha]SFU32959.1 Tat (twin-arginine translocation) pathway signal sequence [Nitrosomonas eutropha]
MNETRRNFIKGVLAGGTSLALGIPGIAQTALAKSSFDSARNCRLLLGNVSVAKLFAKGAQSACSVHSNHHHDAIPILKLESGLSAGSLPWIDSLMQSQNTRWIAVMDQADAAIFTELVRNSTARLLTTGTHTSASAGHAALPLRHAWITASSSYSAGGLLTQILAQSGYDFSIAEDFLTHAKERDMNNISFPEFLPYYLTDQPTSHLYRAGVSLPEAGRLIGWETSKTGKPLFFQPANIAVSQHETRNSKEVEYPQFSNWVEATGYAITAAALGVRINLESCAKRVFVHRSDQHYPDRKKLSGISLVSYVIDV